MHNITFYREACARPRNPFLVALKRRDESDPTQHTTQALRFRVLPNRLVATQ